MRSPSLFESINARATPFEKVGEGFVYLQHFERLTHRVHSIVVGPRGSGKTTLLKMLQLPALSAWKNKAAVRIKPNVDFVGVFVPSDLVWKAQIDGASATPEVPWSRELAALGVAAFHSHILSATLASIEHRLEIRETSDLARFHLELDDRSERLLAERLQQAFGLPERCEALDTVRYGLREQVADLGRLRRRLNRTGRFEPSPDIEDLIDMDFVVAVGNTVGYVEDLTRGEKHRWAMCFDELELCPEDIRRRLLSLLRSTDQRLIWKFATSPYDAEVPSFNVIGPAEVGNDFEVVNLTHGYRRNIEGFSRELVTQVLSSKNEKAPPAAVFGRSVTSDHLSRRKGRVPYAPGSMQHQVIRRLEQSDSTFRAYLKQRGIDSDLLLEIPKNVLHSEIRKVIHYVAVRGAYRPPDDGGSPAKTSLVAYTGDPLLYALCEGNPRLLIGIVSSMLPFREGGRVPEEIQAGMYKEAIARLRSLLRTLGSRARSGQVGASVDGGLTVLQFLDRVGAYFKNFVLSEAFTRDPPGSFVVDTDSMTRFGHVIGAALNAGALIHVAEAGTRVLREMADLEGERFRLSYLLGAYHHLPLRLDRSVPLSVVMDRTATTDNEEGVYVTMRLPGMGG